MGKMITRNSEVLDDFVSYCERYPSLRFWQALRNWSGYHFVLVADADPFINPVQHKDTFNWEGKRQEPARELAFDSRIFVQCDTCKWKWVEGQPEQHAEKCTRASSSTQGRK